MTALPGPGTTPARGDTGAPGSIVRALFAAGIVTYPLVVWYALSHGKPRTAAIVVLCATVPVVIWRWRSAGARAWNGLGVLPFVTVATLGLGAVLDSAGLVLAVPVAVNAVLFVGFASTLRTGSIPMIERFARLQVAQPTAAQERWCRAWTIIWCAFFVVNGATAAALALYAPLAWWAAYNGGLAYVGIGALLAIEWTLRKRRFREARAGDG